MRIVSHHSSPVSEAAPLLGIMAGVGVLMAATCLPELGFLALPGLLVLLPSLLIATR